MDEKLLAACGNDCAACPRYVKPPYEKTEAQLRHTAELWYRIGYRDHVVTNRCQAVCTPEELEIFRRAFFEKEKNLSEERQREKFSGKTELF